MDTRPSDEGCDQGGENRFEIFNGADDCFGGVVGAFDLGAEARSLTWATVEAAR
jgi:hypothetical protein